MVVIVRIPAATANQGQLVQWIWSRRIALMAVDYINWWPTSIMNVPGGGASPLHSGVSSWSEDVEIPVGPATVYAFASLAMIAGAPYYAFAGILGYTYADGTPNNSGSEWTIGSPTIYPHQYGGNPLTVGLPGIFDENVQYINWCWALAANNGSDASGNGSTGASASAVLQVFSFGP
jgi:hypothetical protein